MRVYGYCAFCHHPDLHYYLPSRLKRSFRSSRAARCHPNVGSFSLAILYTVFANLAGGATKEGYQSCLSDELSVVVISCATGPRYPAFIGRGVVAYSTLNDNFCFSLAQTSPLSCMSRAVPVELPAALRPNSHGSQEKGRHWSC